LVCLSLLTRAHLVPYTTLFRSFGYRENPDIDLVLRLAGRKGVVCTIDETSFFTSKPTLVSVTRRGVFGWRRSLFGWMLQNSTSVAKYFNLPPNRVVELGTQVGI